MATGVLSPLSSAVTAVAPLDASPAVAPVPSTPPVASSSASSSVSDLRARISELEATILRLESQQEIVLDQHAFNRNLRAQFKTAMVDSLTKRHISDDKKRAYELLLKALALHTFQKDRKLRASLVDTLTQLHAMLDEVEAAEHAQSTHASSTSRTHLGGTLQEAVSPVSSPSRKAVSRHAASTKQLPPASPVPASPTASRPAVSYSSTLESDAYLHRSDSPPLRSAEDLHLQLRDRRAFLNDVIRRPAQRLPVLLAALDDVLIGRLGGHLRRLAGESARWSTLAAEHLQGLIRANTEKAACQQREKALLDERQALTAQLTASQAAEKRSAARVLELQHELHALSARRETEESRLLQKETKAVAVLVERSHTLRRKVRDAEALLEALEKKKARIQRQGFTTTGGGQGASATNLGSNGGQSHRGVGGGGIGLLSMALQSARDDAQQAQAEVHRLQQQSHSQLPQQSRSPNADAQQIDALSDDAAAPTAPAPFEESKSLGSSQQLPARTMHTSSSSAFSRTSGSSAAGPLVTLATIGRLQVSLPIVPLYAPPSRPAHTRPIAAAPPSASVGYSGVTGHGTSAGLRLGQRLDRRLGDFEKIAVQQMQKASSAEAAGSSGSNIARRRRQQDLNSAGSGTDSVSGSYGVSRSGVRFSGSAYKASHVPVQQAFQPQRPGTSAASHVPFFAGSLAAAALSHPRTASAGGDPSASLPRHQLHRPTGAQTDRSERATARASDDDAPHSDRSHMHAQKTVERTSPAHERVFFPDLSPTAAPASSASADASAASDTNMQQPSVVDETK